MASGTDASAEATVHGTWGLEITGSGFGFRG